MFILKNTNIFLGLTILSVASLFALNFFEEPQPAIELVEPEINYEFGATVAITPIPFSIDLNPDKVLLGKLLFHDPRLSGDNSVSCSSCRCP
ncbi:MAG: cytochrome c peroxidase [Oceanospirillaceae bacterium]|jgi:cytochrome c peroxidase